MNARTRLAGLLLILMSLGTVGCSVPPGDSGSKLNLWVQAVEITQATQTWVPVNDSPMAADPPTYPYPDSPTAMPLVANRSTVARVYAGVAGVASVDGARAVLRCFTDPGYSVPCPGAPSQQHEDEVTVRVDDSLDGKRNYANASWNIGLPTAWTAAGSVYLEAEVLAPTDQPECTGCGDGANRLRVAKVPFHAVPAFSSLVYLVQVERQVGNQTFKPSEAAILSQVDFLKGRYPIDQRTLPTDPSDSWPWDATWRWTDDETQELGDRCSALHRDISQAFPKIRESRLAVYALVDDGFPCGGLGGGGFAYGNANPDHVGALAEEVGHAIGLNHAGPPPGHGAECDPVEWCDKTWPWPHGTIGAYGFDVFNDTVYVPGTSEDSTHDFMSYGGPTKWVSPLTWTRIFTAFTGTALSLPGPLAQGDSMEPGELLQPGKSLTSANGKYTFVYQTDGNLVLYRNADSQSLWESGTRGKPLGVVVLQADGNLVMYGLRFDSHWSSDTAGNPGSRLLVQDDGNVVIYRTDNTSAWDTDTKQ